MDILKIVLYIIFVIDCIALSAIILFAGRKVSRIGNNWRYGGYLLGTEQGTFYGRCTCKVYKVSCYPFLGACSSTEP